MFWFAMNLDKFSKYCFHKFIMYFNSAYKCLSPFINALILLSSAFLQYNVTTLIRRYPSWAPMINKISDYLPDVVIWTVGINFILSLVDSVCSDTIKKLMVELSEEKQKNKLITSNVKNLFEGYLLQLATHKIGFGKNNKVSDRITLYLHDGSSKFIPFGRYAVNPKFSSPGRTEYPDNEGCISKGWQHGWYFQSNMGNTRNYTRKSEELYNITPYILSKMKMHSKFYAVKRIENNGKPIALLVVESLEKNRFIENEIKQKLEQEESFIAELIRKLESYIPKPSNAKSRGF
jgi:hypothetical protein